MGCFEGEVLNDVVMERTDLKRSCDWVVGSEAEPCAKKQAVEAQNDAECNPQPESHLKEELEPCLESQVAEKELANYADNSTEEIIIQHSVQADKNSNDLEELEPQVVEKGVELEKSVENSAEDIIIRPSVQLEKEETESCLESDDQVMDKAVDLENPDKNSTEDIIMQPSVQLEKNCNALEELEPCVESDNQVIENGVEIGNSSEDSKEEIIKQPSVLLKNSHALEKLEPCMESDNHIKEKEVEVENSSENYTEDITMQPSVQLEKNSRDLEELEPCVESDNQVIEMGVELDNSADDIIMQPSVQLEKNCRDLEELEPCVESNNQVIEMGVKLDNSAEDIIMQPGVQLEKNSHALEEVELKIYAENSTDDIDGIDSKFSPKQQENEALADSIHLSDPLQAKDNSNLSVIAEKCTKEALDYNELENRVKEASNEDIFSEVSDPNLSPGNTTSSLCVGATLSKEPGSCNIPGGCAEVSSLYSGSSSSESESSSEQEDTGNEVSFTSCVVLEIPKHVSTTGIRKITFRFSKRKEDYENVSSVSSTQPDYGQPDYGQPDYGDYSDGSYRLHAWNASVADQGFHERRVPLSHKQLQMSQKVNPDIYPANVKKLLATGILEGARVKYISVNRETELSGMIWNDGYLCSCSSCNYSRVLSAYEFELHAGVKTRHPNNHIYLENGKPVYSIVQELKTAPLSMIDDVMQKIAGSSINMAKYQIWKASLLQQNDSGDLGDLSSSGQTPGFYYPDLSYPSPMRKDIRMPPSFFSVNSQFYQHDVKVMGETRKRVVKKPGWLSSSSDPDFELEKGCEGGNGSGSKKSRDNDLHRLLFLPNGLPDGTDLAYYSKGKKILGGYKQDNGIVCSCCHSVISPSQFESHAGWAVKRQPYRNIYTSTGLTLHDIALMLANGRSIASSNSDDMCAACGDGGDLLLCRGCPRAFHTDCLGSQCGSASDWLCPYCADKSIPARRGPGRPPLRQTRVVKAPLFVGGGCVVCRAPDFSVAKFDDRTVLLCDQCEKEYHVGCLRDSGLCDLKELPRDKWFCCNDCHMIHKELQNFALSGSQFAPPEISAAIIKKHQEKGLMEVPATDFKWRILSGKSRFSEHLPLLSRASAIFRECFDPIVAKSGRDLIPIMVYGRNISGQEFGGMYCVVLMVKSVVVSAGLLRIFGKEVAELPLVATCRESQGKGYFLALFSCIERLLASMNVKSLVLPAAEEAESIWTKRLGFKRMSNARVAKYEKEIQFTIFKGTTMLEKEVQSEDILDI